MLLKAASLVIDPENPFAADRFELADFARAVTTIVKESPSSFVLSLDAPWGQGKTTFLEMWRHHLRGEGVHSLYFNAWQNDFASDPLIALIGELSGDMEELGVRKSSKLGKQMVRLKKAGIKIAQRSLPAAVKLATMGVLDLTDVTEAALADAGEKFAEAEIARYETSKQSIVIFRQELERFAKQLGSESGKNFPLVIIIDELDRCRPDYAIKVLETVKHLFAVAGVFFVIATDTRQLSSAIRHVYGLDASADDYLRRFFDLGLLLPEPSAKKFVPSLIERHALADFFGGRTHPELAYDREQTIAAFTALFAATKCSLRDQQKCFTLLCLAAGSVGENQYFHPLLLCVLIVLRVKHFELYEKFVTGQVSGSEVVEQLKASPAGRKFLDSDRGYGPVVFAYLLLATKGRAEREAAIQQVRERSGDDSLQADERQRAGRLLQIMGAHDFRNSVGAMKASLPRIELFARSLDQDDEF